MFSKLFYPLFTLLLLVCASGSAMAQTDTLPPTQLDTTQYNNNPLLQEIKVYREIDSATCCFTITISIPAGIPSLSFDFHLVSFVTNSPDDQTAFSVNDTVYGPGGLYRQILYGGQNYSFTVCPLPGQDSIF